MSRPRGLLMLSPRGLVISTLSIEFMRTALSKSAMTSSKTRETLFISFAPFHIFAIFLVEQIIVFFITETANGTLLFGRDYGTGRVSDHFFLVYASRSSRK